MYVTLRLTAEDSKLNSHLNRQIAVVAICLTLIHAKKINHETTDYGYYISKRSQ